MLILCHYTAVDDDISQISWLDFYSFIFFIYASTGSQINDFFFKEEDQDLIQ